MKTALIIDLTNLYMEIRNAFPGKRLNVIPYVETLTGLDIAYKIAYSKQRRGEALGFAHLLECNGFVTHFAAQHRTTEIALQAATILPDVDCLVIGSNERDMMAVFRYARKLGKRTKCFACNIPKDFKAYAECLTITEDLLSDIKPNPLSGPA